MYMCMSITFDDQGPITPTIRAQRIEERAFSLEKLLLNWGLAKNKKQASMLAVVFGIGIICICGLITLHTFRQEPLDESRYYNPITGEPIDINQ